MAAAGAAPMAAPVMAATGPRSCAPRYAWVSGAMLPSRAIWLFGSMIRLPVGCTRDCSVFSSALRGLRSLNEFGPMLISQTTFLLG